MRFPTPIHATPGPEWTLKFLTGLCTGPRARRHGTFCRVSRHELVGTVLAGPRVDLHRGRNPDGAGATTLTGPLKPRLTLAEGTNGQPD